MTCRSSSVCCYCITANTNTTTTTIVPGSLRQEAAHRHLVLRQALLPGPGGEHEQADAHPEGLFYGRDPGVPGQGRGRGAEGPQCDRRPGGPVRGGGWGVSPADGGV